jgi:hypothetical protein
MKPLAVLALVVAGCTPGCTVDGPPIPDGGAVRQAGEVTLRQKAGQGSGSLAASFAIDRCTTQVIGNCTVLDCRGSDGGAAQTVSAGTIKLTGAAAPLMLVPGNDGVYPTSTLSGQVWRGGESIDVTAAGSLVPMFTSAVKAPATLTVEAPLGGAISIDRSRDYNISWSTPLGDDVRVRLTLDAGARIECIWSGGSLMQPIPSFALELLGPGTGDWEVDAANTKTFTAGGFVVSVAVVQNGQDMRGLDTNGPLTIQ